MNEKYFLRKVRRTKKLKKSCKLNIYDLEEAISQLKRKSEIISTLKKEIFQKEDYLMEKANKKLKLLKSGAEKLAFLFQLGAHYQVDVYDSENGHRDYCVTCNIFSVEKDQKLGSGVGVCSTLETKFRFHNTHSLEDFNIADIYHSVIEIAQQRAFILAIIEVLALSDVFIQEENSILALKEFNKTNKNSPKNKQALIYSHLDNLKDQCGNIWFEKISDEEKILQYSALRKDWLSSDLSMEISGQGLFILDRAIVALKKWEDGKE